jgi:tRNA threonylcarbamoyladenosine modification (KEOPS) complex Cgi121 subunit
MITERVRSHIMWVQGFRDARVVNSERALHDLRGFFDGIELQLLRADRIAGIEHIVFAARTAVDSFIGRDRRAKHLSMEFLLFATGEHQIVEAIKLLGVDESSAELALVGLSEHNIDSQGLIDRATEIVRGIPDDSVMEIGTTKKQEELKKAYNISDRQLNAARMPGETEYGLMKRLVLERSALLVLEN